MALGGLFRRIREVEGTSGALLAVEVIGVEGEVEGMEGEGEEVEGMMVGGMDGEGEEVEGMGVEEGTPEGILVVAIKPLVEDTTEKHVIAASTLIFI